ncbi:MarR family winged helix-turn-helix transcriptional regulator [Robbsia andropogonis]|uniref:MarR family winged helix-turn-helix transcriptional regulator n=1 Tax=Robbsia andropogonis TaxID=28092 RepID=UPI00046345F4|nr:MarR family transcriptional regulator [Robbsia andropogonis]
MKPPHGPSLCYCLASRQSARYLSRLFDEHLAPSGLSSSQFSLLVSLASAKTLTIVQLAEFMVMERTTLVRALKPLQQSGWVLNQLPTSGRAMILTLTPAGQIKVKEAAQLWKAAQQAFENLIGKDRAVALRSELQNVKKICTTSEA